MINWSDTEWKSRNEYIEDMADTFGIDYESAHALADILGDEELFDGFLTALEDASMML